MRALVVVLLMFGSWVGGVLISLAVQAFAAESMDMGWLWAISAFVLALALIGLFWREQTRTGVTYTWAWPR